MMTMRLGQREVTAETDLLHDPDEERCRLEDVFTELIQAKKGEGNNTSSDRASGEGSRVLVGRAKTSSHEECSNTI